MLLVFPSSRFQQGQHRGVCAHPSCTGHTQTSDQCDKRPPATCRAERRFSLSSVLSLSPVCASSWLDTHSETECVSRSKTPGTPNRTSRPFASSWCRSHTELLQSWLGPWSGYDWWSAGTFPSCCICLNPECSDGTFCPMMPQKK